MNKKSKHSRVFRHYFAETGDYLVVVDAEAAFFKALIGKKDDLGNNFTIHQALENVNFFLGDPPGRPLDVLVEFQVNDPRTQSPQKIFLGTKLCPPKPKSEPMISHYLCLGDSTNLLTKIHHDRDFNPNASEKKPTTHIQMGGRIDTNLAAKAGRSCCWREEVDKPRLPSIPVCTALLWHWAFLEYREAEQISPILSTRWWNQMVQKAEESILKPFFGDGLKLMDREPQMGLLNAFYTPVSK
jgi:hypothetical protein